MSIKGAALRGLNRCLRPLDVEIKRLDVDFDSRLLSADRERRMVADLAETIDRFLRHSAIFPCTVDIDLERDIAQFYGHYLTCNARASGGGSRFCNLLWLFAIARTLNPALIIDSGTFRGTSAWALNAAAPRADIHSFDITPAARTVVVPHVRYHISDWSEVSLPPAAGGPALAFFDDHVDQVRRIEEAFARGLRYLIFDDDLDLRRVARIASDPGCLPKISFLFDESLTDGETLEWYSMGKRHRYTVDRAYLDASRLKIRRVQRLPDLSPLTGTKYQMPFRLVELESAVRH